ncbi:unnamed protein product [Caenorhabditis auriculariae]|uniref:Uncharacterized protein n=1 Tax=Caenorhabditis auriculariae TaxID=2777116 RepID=A0A8S1GV24_9PELO|nr:unnamed protein product [Caenorhabditis auriculariae]
MDSSRLAVLAFPPSYSHMFLHVVPFPHIASVNFLFWHFAVSAQVSTRGHALQETFCQFCVERKPLKVNNLHNEQREADRLCACGTNDLPNRTNHTHTMVDVNTTLRENPFLKNDNCSRRILRRPPIKYKNDKKGSSLLGSKMKNARKLWR